ncbi:hypothetical protein EW146_g7504, partial [Bondarzewia mesenterica]
YQLVAGGEELFQENGLLASADPKEQSPDSVSSEASVKEERREPHSPLVPSSSASASDFAFDPAYAASQLPSHGAVDYAAPSCAQSNLYLAPLTPLPSPTRVGDRSIKDEALVLASPYVFTEPSFSPHPNISTRRNCVSSLSLWAEGMQPLTVDVDRLSPTSRTSAPSPSRVCLNIKLSLAPLDALGSPTLYGFQSTVIFASPWHASAQCITRLYNADGCQQEEVGAFELLPSNLTGADQLVTALFPDSWLARCRWLTAGKLRIYIHLTSLPRLSLIVLFPWSVFHPEPRASGVQTRITQQIVVDNEDLGCIIYDLDRPLNAPPSAEFVGFNKECRARPAPISIPPSAPGALYSPATWSPHEPAPFVPRLDDASLFSTFAQPPIVEMGRRTALPRRIPLVRPVLVSRTFFRRSPCVPTAI